MNINIDSNILDLFQIEEYRLNQIYRYKKIEKLGSGAFGIGSRYVVLDRENNQ